MRKSLERTVPFGLVIAFASLPLATAVFGQSNPTPAPATKVARDGKLRQAQSSAKPAPPAAADTSADAERRALAVASYDGGAVTVGELEDAIAVSSPFAQQRALEPAALRTLLDRSIRFEMLAMEAERRGYGNKPSVVEAVNQNAVQLMIKREIDEKVTPQSVPDDAVKKYYDEHLSEFVRPQMRRASHILLKSEADAKALLAETKTTDMRTFRDLARQKSTDESSKLRGGDLRYFDPKGKAEDAGASIDPATAKATFALKAVGDTTGVIKTAAGFVIVQLTGIRPALEETAKQADERIRTRLWREQREGAIDALYQSLKQSSQPVTHPELLDAIVFESGPASAPTKSLPAGFPHTQPPAAEAPKP